jgi:hypothetical protein
VNEVAPRATWSEGVVRYSDARGVKADLDTFLRHRILCVSGARFPSPGACFRLTLELPGARAFSLEGRLMSQRDTSALIRVESWAEGAWSAIEAAARGAADEAPKSTRAKKTSPPSRRTTPAPRAAVASTGPARKATPRPARRPSSPRASVDQVRLVYERRAAGNLFVALGIHHSDPPAAIEAALVAAQKEFGPTSAAAERSPEWAAKVLALAERAHKTLSDRIARRRHRKELGVDVEGAAHLAVTQAKVLKARGDVARARALLEAAIDLDPRHEYVTELKLVGRPTEALEQKNIEVVRQAKKKGPHDR